MRPPLCCAAVRSAGAGADRGGRTVEWRPGLARGVRRRCARACRIRSGLSGPRSSCQEEAVLGGIAVAFAPFVVMLAATVPFAALVAFFGIAIAAGSATAIQFWFARRRGAAFSAPLDLIARRDLCRGAVVDRLGWLWSARGNGTWLAVFLGLIGTRDRWRHLDDQPEQESKCVNCRGSPFQQPIHTAPRHPESPCHMRRLLSSAVRTVTAGAWHGWRGLDRGSAMGGRAVLRTVAAMGRRRSNGCKLKIPRA